MPRLNQIVAVEKGVKAEATAALTRLHRASQIPELQNGLTRVYEPKDAEGDQLPGETSRVQVRYPEVLKDVRHALTKLLDVVATKDWANCNAKGTIKVGDRVILESVPATHLLFLEKQLVDIHTFVAKLPTLDPAITWTLDESADCFRSEEVKTTRTKKVPKSHVAYEATDRHPAQIQMFTEDVVEGYWHTTKFSGSIPESTKRQLLERITELQKAVKFAREEANSAEAPPVKVADALFDYLLSDI